jgi:hypothetical protein
MVKQELEDSMEYTALAYRTDRHGNVRKTKVGKAFKGKKQAINLCLEAYPLVNQDGECWVTLVPYDPNFGEKYE